jgi:hypothetical protein
MAIWTGYLSAMDALRQARKGDRNYGELAHALKQATRLLRESRRRERAHNEKCHSEHSL